MWCRKRLDIRWSDLLAGVWYGLTRRSSAAQCRAAEVRFRPAGDALCCLSVRSAWDMLLQALALPAGSHVLMSALTIRDMVSIVEHHGLTPVPLDLELDTAAPSVQTLERALSPDARLLIVAHLFGGRIPLDPLIELARSRGLTIVEDCAQAYVGPDFRGHPRADASLFSFGTIKTATALGGGLAIVRDRDVLERMRSIHAGYAVQGRWKFLRRIGKYGFLKAVSTRRMLAVMLRVWRGIGVDYNGMINRAVRGFSEADGVGRFRRRPSPPLAALLERRLRRFDAGRFARKASRGNLLANLIGSAVPVPGVALGQHCYWVFPIWSDDPEATLAGLRQAGFDAAQGHSMDVVPAPPGRDDLEPSLTRQLLRHMVFVPLYPEMPERELRRMAELLLDQPDGETDATTTPSEELTVTARDAADLSPQTTDGE